MKFHDKTPYTNSRSKCELETQEATLSQVYSQFSIFFFFSLFSYAFGMPHFHICFWLFAETSCYRHREGIRTAMLMCQFHWLKCYCDVDKTLLGTPNPIGLRWDRAIIVACFHLNPIIFTFDPKVFFFFPTIVCAIFSH